MKYKTKATSNSRQHFNAWQIATKGGKLSRVSVSRYRKACAAAFWLNWLNDYADRCAEFDNDPERYTEERSAKMARRLEELEHTTAEHLAPLGLVFCCCSHFYGIAEKGTEKNIYIRY